ncbi:unnamed protein product [Brassica rapa subsp. trilocularis]
MSWKKLITCCSRTTSKKSSRRESSSLKNGGLLVEKLIRVSNGDYNPFFIFTEQELKQATKDYDQDLVCLVDDNYKLFEGVLENRGAVLIKKTNEHEELVEYCIREIAIAAYVSSNMNLVKLLGCCLESKVPIIVFEYRIRIAAQVADAIAYLHLASDYMTNHDTTPVAESSLISVSSPKRRDLLMFLKAILIKDGKDNALEASAELAASCVEILPEKRPTFEEVAKKLKHIQNM